MVLALLSTFEFLVLLFYCHRLPYTVLLCIEVFCSISFDSPLRLPRSFQFILTFIYRFSRKRRTHTHPPNSPIPVLRSYAHFNLASIVCGLFFYFALFSHSPQNTLAHKPFISPRVRFRFRFIISFEWCKHLVWWWRCGCCWCYYCYCHFFCTAFFLIYSSFICFTSSSSCVWILFLKALV